MNTITDIQIKQNFEQVLIDLKEGDIVITKNGNPVAFLSKTRPDTSRTPVKDIKRHAIKDYFDGKLMRYEAMRICDYSWYGELLEDAGRFGIVIPMISEEQNAIMESNIAKLLAEHNNA